jgi:hypothetical protein
MFVSGCRRGLEVLGNNHRSTDQEAFETNKVIFSGIY